MKLLFKIIFIAVTIFMTTSHSFSSPIIYNFGGKLTQVSDPFDILEKDRKIYTGANFNAIYEINPESSLVSGTIGNSPNRNSLFNDAILNFTLYIGSTNLINSNYRIQTFHNVNGFINGKPADWIQITTDGGKDNYNNIYGKNMYLEYIDSYLNLVDLSGTALDSYNKTYFGNIPLTIDLSQFSFGTLQVLGEHTETFKKYQIRGDINSFSNSQFIPVPEPSSIFLLLIGIIALIRKNITKGCSGL